MLKLFLSWTKYVVLRVEEGGPLLSAFKRFKLLLPFKQVVRMRRQGRQIFKFLLPLEKKIV